MDNLDAKTLKLTWIDYPMDNGLILYINRVGGRLRLLLIQPEPSGTTDAIGFGRELVLAFSQPVSAGSVRRSFRAGWTHPADRGPPDPPTQSVSPGRDARRSGD